MPPPGRKTAASRSSSTGSPKCMKRPPLQVPTAVCLIAASAIASNCTVHQGMPHHSILAWGALVALLFVFLWVDLHYFARGRSPSFREALLWSIGWIAVSLIAAVVLMPLAGKDDAVVYTT